MKIGKRKSAEINEAIIKIENDDSIQYECWPGTGKKVPSIGWFWREVAFNEDSCVLGILPVLKRDGILGERNDTPKVGFMENNKWGYESFVIKGEPWDELRRLIVEATEQRTTRSLATVVDFLQTLMPRTKKRKTRRKS